MVIFAGSWLLLTTLIISLLTEEHVSKVVGAGLWWSVRHCIYVINQHFVDRSYRLVLSLYSVRSVINGLITWGTITAYCDLFCIRENEREN